MPSILDKALSVEDIPAYPKGVLYSPFGDGKTQFCADAPNPVWIDFERSYETLRAIGKNDIPVFRPRKFSEATEFAREAAKKFDNIIVDTVSSMQVMYMNEYLDKQVADSNGRRQKYLRYQGDYNYATNELTDFFLTMQNAECGVIFIAHEKIYFREDADGNPTTTISKIVPDLTPAVRSGLGKFVNVIAYLEKDPGSSIKPSVGRKLYLNKTATIMAKNRLGIQEQFLINPKFTDVFKGAV